MSEYAVLSDDKAQVVGTVVLSNPPSEDSVFRILERAVVPAGHRVRAINYTIGETSVVEVLNTEPVPPPPDAAATQLTPEDVERLMLTIIGVTRAGIDTAKRDRGKPLP